MYTHSHYSPYQFATDQQLAEPHKQVVKEKKLSITAHLERKKLTKDLHCTLPIEVAHSVTSLPNAFISPNHPDVCRQINSVFGF